MPNTSRKAAKKKPLPTKRSGRGPDRKRKNPFEDAIDNFILEIDSLEKATRATMSTVIARFREGAKTFTRFAEERRVGKRSPNNKVPFRVQPHELPAFRKILNNLTATSSATGQVPRVFMCALVHQYDAFLGKLLRAAFMTRPETLNGSQRQLTLSDLEGFATIEAAREYVLEKEVESVIRESHIAQFEWMEGRFGMPLRKHLDAWPTFVELTERRNLFVHCDGIVTDQYLSVCQRNGVKGIDQVRRGDELDVSEAYFGMTVECILEIGIKLGNVLWRKLCPKELKEADESFHMNAYEFLVDERYELVKKLLSFARDTFKKTSAENIRLMNLINLSIADSFSGDKKAAFELLDAQDWTACEDQFKLAVAVIKEDYSKAVAIMKQIGSKGVVGREDYVSWPLFRKFREAKPFLRAYKDLFGEQFILPSKEIADAISKAADTSKTRIMWAPQK